MRLPIESLGVILDAKEAVVYNRGVIRRSVAKSEPTVGER